MSQTKKEINSKKNRVMVLLAATTGLRRSELFALKWHDIDFSSKTLNVRRVIYNQIVGKCKTRFIETAVVGPINSESVVVMEGAE